MPELTIQMRDHRAPRFDKVAVEGSAVSLRGMVLMPAVGTAVCQRHVRIELALRQGVRVDVQARTARVGPDATVDALEQKPRRSNRLTRQV